MSKKFNYRAIKNGTLSNPYRYVKEGEYVALDKELKCSWLVPADKFKKKDPLPPFGHMAKQAKTGDLPEGVRTENEAYDIQIVAIKAREALEDGLNLTGLNKAGLQEVAERIGLPVEGTVPEIKGRIEEAIAAANELGEGENEETGEEGSAGTGDQDVV